MAIAKKSSFEFKDRTYVLKGITPVSFSLNVRHSQRNPLQYFDPIKKNLRSLRYATNFSSPFEDEQEGDVILGQCVFLDGKISVPKENISLQKLLSIYHPFLGIKYIEFKPEEIADNELEELNSVFDAQKIIRETEFEDIEAIARVLWKSKVSKMSSGEIKRDLMVYAKKNPKEIISLSQDEDIKLRNLAIRATDGGYIRLINDNRTFIYNNKEKTKIIDIKFGTNPYSELASFFKTDEGVEVVKYLITKIN